MVDENHAPKPWHQSEVGARLIENEANELGDILSRLCGYHLIFLGDPQLAYLCAKSLITHRIAINPHIAPLEGISPVYGEMELVPILSDSVDAVIMPHILEHVDKPHEVLRETHRILIPEGHIVITGFNPFSLWGLWHAWKKLKGDIPIEGKMLTMNRVRDWLKLLNFQIISVTPFYYRPPVSSDRAYKAFGFLERWAKLGWPLRAGAYTLVAVKRVIPLTPIRAKWRTEQTLWQPVVGAQPFKKHE